MKISAVGNRKGNYTGNQKKEAPKTLGFQDYTAEFLVACIVAFSISYSTDFHFLNLAVFLLSIFEYSNEIHSNSKYLITSKGMDYLYPTITMELFRNM